MKSILFSYTDSRGNTTDREVVDWKETGRYIQGICVASSEFRTFRKDRIVRYLGEGEAQLSRPYTPPPPKPETGPEICFTGFPKIQRAHLEQIATASKMVVRKDVTKALAFLCCGPNAGPAKMDRARERDCLIIDEPGLKMMLDTGELPELWED